MHVEEVQFYDTDWRIKFKKLFQFGLKPSEISFRNDGQDDLFKYEEPHILDDPKCGFKCSRELMQNFDSMMMHQDLKKWDHAYAVFYRYMVGNKDVLRDITWDPVVKMNIMLKQVGRDIHKMHAFVRFKRVLRDGKEIFLAWHESDHLIFKAASSFFIKRFGSMEWMIMGPKQQMGWDLKNFYFQEEELKKQSLPEDEMDELWKNYYTHIFNPARVKVKMMKSEMPVRYWKNLPEAELIQSLIKEAPARVQKMTERAEVNQRSADAFLNAQSIQSLSDLEAQISICQACPLFENEVSLCHGQKNIFRKNQTFSYMAVLGLMDDEESYSRSLIKVKDVLWKQGIQWHEVYVASANKHYAKHTHHNSPNVIGSCRPFLREEIRVIQPKKIFVFGSQAAMSVMGYPISIAQHLNETLDSAYGVPVNIMSRID